MIAPNFGGEYCKSHSLVYGPKVYIVAKMIKTGVIHYPSVKKQEYLIPQRTSPDIFMMFTVLGKDVSFMLERSATTRDGWNPSFYPLAIKPSMAHGWKIHHMGMIFDAHKFYVFPHLPGEGC